MSTVDNTQTISLPAGADLSAAQFQIVKLSGGTVVLGSAAGELVLGVLLNDPESGQAATVCIGGKCKVKAGAAFAVDAYLKTDTGGKAVTADRSDASAVGSNVFAQAVELASAADEVVECIVNNMGLVPATDG